MPAHVPAPAPAEAPAPAVPRRLRGWLALVAGLVLLLTLPLALPAGATSTAAAAAATPGVLLPNGRLVTPAGSPYDPDRQPGDASYDQGDFPLGLALSPDGNLAVSSLNGRGYGAPHTNGSFCDQHSDVGATKPNSPECPGVPDALKGSPQLTAPDEGLDVTDLRTGKVVQVKVVPTSNDPAKTKACNQGFNCNGFGVTFSPDGRHVYASGGGADAIYDFPVTGDVLGTAKVVPVPSPGSQVPAYPIIGSAAGYPRAVKATPDGKTLLVADEFDSTIEAFDVSGGKVPVLEAQATVPGGVPGPVPVAYLYGIALSPDGAYAYVTAEGTGVVYVIDVAALVASGPLSALPPGPLAGTAAAVAVPVPVPGINHPTGLAVTPDGSALYVTGTDSDNVAVLPLVGGVVPAGATPTLVPVGAVPRAASTEGASPDAVAFDATGKRAYVALAGDDAVAVLDTVSHAVLGYVPTGWYPTDVAVGPKDGQVYALAAKGLGSRYIAGVGGYTPAPGAALPSGAAVPDGSYYDAENMPGLLTRFAPPTRARLAAYTSRTKTDILHAAGLDQRSAHNPIPVAVGGTSPITHVVYIVRENRTFDQVFGDLALMRADVDADPALQILAPATPNAHALSGRYGLADHFFSDGEGSIDGHWWTSSANANDYIQKSWRQYYSPRGRPQDSAVLPITSPPGCSIFQAMQKKTATDPGFTFENYGELVGLVTPNTSVGQPQANLCNGVGAAGPNTTPFLDPNYPTEQTLTPDDRTRAAEFLKNSGLTADGKDAGNGNSLRNFNYLIMSEDHTSGLGGVQTPRSQVAQNDAGVGDIVSALSKSKDWSSTAVFVTEDDSQDGIDHVDGHRNILLVASPYAKQTSADGCVGGYIAHDHYDQAGVLRTVELLLGVPAISAYDSGATPLYDLFQDKDAASRLTQADLAPYQVAPAPSFIDEKVASLPKTPKNQSLQAYSKSLDLTHVDAAEAGLEYVLWQTTMPTAVPAELAAKVGATGTAERETALTPSARLDAPAGGLTLTPTEVRPGSVPALSTTTGRPLTGRVTPACAARPIAVTTPVAPGQTALPGMPTPGHASASGGELAFTGLPLWPAWLALGLVLTGAGARAVRRPHR